MSWFGLFHSVFGLGLLAKDAISEAYDDTVQREKAQKNGNEVYFVNGYKMRSTKTGRDAYIDRGLTKWDHICVKDKKTDMVIDDLTIRINSEKQKEIKDKATEKGSIFYRTTQFDTSPLHPSPVYMCDSIPGYFKKRLIRDDGFLRDIYEEGQLKTNDNKYNGGTHYVDVKYWENGKRAFFEDGSLYKVCVLGKYWIKDRPLTEKEKAYQATKYYKKGEKYI